MSLKLPGFERSIATQIAINRARTPAERMEAFYALMTSLRELAPRGPEARERRLRMAALRQREREVRRDEYRRLIAAGRADPSAGV